jgi:hypothetical protein
MATNYPGSLDTGTEQPSPLASTEMDDAGFERLRGRLARWQTALVEMLLRRLR